MRHYKSLNILPIWHFREAKDKVDLRYLLILDDYYELPKTSKKVSRELQEIWDEMDYEYMEIFGISHKFKMNMLERQEILILELQDLGEEDGNIQNVLESLRYDYELKYGKPGDNKPTSLQKETAMIEEKLNFQIDVMTTSVVKYYSYIENIKQKSGITNNDPNGKN